MPTILILLFYCVLNGIFQFRIVEGYLIFSLNKVTIIKKYCCNVARERDKITVNESGRN